MTIKLINNDGTGAIADSSPISFSYSEQVTSLEPSKLDGGTSQVNVTALSVSGNKVGNTHPDSKLLINNSMSLVHSESGEVKFDVKKASVTQEAVAIVGDTLESRLNVERTAGPHGGSGYTLLSAIEYYCSLVGIYRVLGTVDEYADLPATPNEGEGYIVSDTNKFYVYIDGAWSDKLYMLNFEDGIDTAMDLIPVNFIGWKGNVWEHLKMLAAAVSISATDNVGFEFYVDNDSLNFRQAKTTEIEFTQRDLISQSIAVDAFDASQDMDIYNYNTRYAVNTVVQDTSLEKSALSSDAQGATTADAFQVNAGESITKRITINASLDSVNQPVAVDEISPFPYPASGTVGQYAIAGADGIFIRATQWIGEGGSLKVALTENPLEIEVTVTAPPKNGLRNVTSGTNLSYEPYKIGVETSGSVDYPAIYITGTGVFYNKVLQKIQTGAPSEYAPRETAATIDNPFITDSNSAYTRGVAAAQVICGPNVSLTESSSTIEPFGETPGKIRTVESNKYRIQSVDYAVDNTSITAVPCSSFADFELIWDGLDFDDFTNTALDPTEFPFEAMKFNEFTIIPLMEAEPVI